MILYLVLIVALHNEADNASAPDTVWTTVSQYGHRSTYIILGIFQSTLY